MKTIYLILAYIIATLVLPNINLFAQQPLFPLKADTATYNEGIFPPINGLENLHLTPGDMDEAEDYEAMEGADESMSTDSSFKSSANARYNTWSKDKFFFYRNTYPHHGTPCWGDERWAANGIAHNQDFIFICALERTFVGTTGKTDYIIWKIPRNYPLDRDYRHDPTVKRFQLSKLPANTKTRKEFKKYKHIGDIDVAVIEGEEYILAPLTGGSKPIIGFFRTSDLSFVNFHYPLINYHQINAMVDLGWCAYSMKRKRLCVSNDYNSFFAEFTIKKGKISSAGHDAFMWTKPKLHFIDEAISNMQGGCFTSDGKYLYVSAGLPQKNLSTDGITVFETTNWKVVKRSINLSRNPSAQGCFHFDFNTGSWYNPWGAEPEGLDIWDADDGRTPHVSGQLHVLLDDHSFWKTNDVSLVHYGIFIKPKDRTVSATSWYGTSYTNSKIAAILVQCYDVVNNAPKWFPCGTTTVKFFYRKNTSILLGYTKVTVKCKELWLKTDSTELSADSVLTGHDNTVKASSDIEKDATSAYLADATRQAQKPVTEVADLKQGISDLKVFPNPAHDQLTIVFRSPSKSAWTIRFYDAVGHMAMLKQGLAAEGANSIITDVSSLKKGFYAISISTNNFENTLKVLIE